jgi:CheY-like chemotaxis protein/HPt (histidine-containing phosphotransfer) domain-containing protein
MVGEGWRLFADSSDGPFDEGLLELAWEYLQDVPDMIGQMRMGLIMAQFNNDGGLLHSVIMLAHQMKGTAACLGFAPLSKLAAKLEALLQSLSSKSLAETQEVTAQIYDLLEQCLVFCQEQGVGAPVPKQLDLPSEATVPSEAEVSSEVREVIPEEVAAQQVDYFAFAWQEVDENDKPENFSENQLKSRRALIVDCDGYRAHQLFDLLKAEGWLVRSSFSSLEGLCLVDEFMPQVLFLAGNMPALNGFALCRMVRCNPRWQNLPLLIVCSSLEERALALEAGATDFLFAPYFEAEVKLRLAPIIAQEKALPF